MKISQNQAVSKNHPHYTLPAAGIAELFGMSEASVHLYASSGLLPRHADDRFDTVWLLNLALGQQVTARYRQSLPVAETVVVGWLFSVGDDLEKDDVRAFGRVFQRNGFTRQQFVGALDEALAFYDTVASSPQSRRTETRTCN
ncbi:hypothetical protein [Burkholderia pyrrocinia]|uniref:hypothetical protein n=1 Tax=Burkholderia pyrrocinia TaxID=60550 RepID=UPI00158BE8DB|nr:hypothetical protein [Burkholderia pyrrocinia]